MIVQLQTDVRFIECNGDRRQHRSGGGGGSGDAGRRLRHQFITFVTQSCVVTTDSRQRQHCLERYRVKHEAIVSARPDDCLAAQPIPYAGMREVV